MALAGGVNLILSQHLAYDLNHATMLSPDGR
jgi:acyl transferase domain-containing protein